ncbi:DUF4349 domain-containing protein [Apibacter sp. HY039]|uniref:DUF4349 domain-containing protein n=1 Tax=Apibacter sp. HY039 TaxID=2501476 RepID=UPI000FEBFAE9|nr:DUF4349 domain-containing protein [Apibacter sp. HY039]
MKTISFLVVILLSSILFIRCSKQEKKQRIVENEIIAFDSISSTTGVKDPDKKFIHESNIIIEVKDALKSTLAIEKNVIALEGYVGKSELKSDIISESITPISKDSTRETKVYSVVSYMEIRVPQKNLNSFLLTLNQEIGFITSRNLEIFDVSINNKLLNDQNIDSVSSIDDLTNNKTTSNKASKYQDIKKELLNDKIKFATVIITLQEKESIKNTLIPNTKNYKTNSDSNFGYQLKTSFLRGSYMFEKMVTFLCSLWPLWLLLLSGYFFYRKYKTKKSNSN